MLKTSMRHFILSLATAAIGFAALAVAATPTQDQSSLPPMPSLPNNGYMILKRMPMQELAISTPKTDTSAMTIVDIVQTNPSLTTFSQALKAADLTATLEGDGPFTILAPNDAAFAKISPNAWDDLMKPENKDKLVALLTYHVLPGKIESSDIKTMKATSSNGATLNIKSDNNGVTINNARVLQKDIEASNGVIHVIDTVLVP